MVPSLWLLFSDLNDTVVTAELTTDECSLVEPGQTVTMNVHNGWFQAAARRCG